MALCIDAGGEALLLAITAFTLSWTHSVERIAWEEDWRVTPAGLELVAARVRGSGAGMEPGADAVLVDGWWAYAPGLPPLRELVLGNSGAVGGVVGAWTLCGGGRCIPLGVEPGEPLRLAPCIARDGG